MPPKLMEVSVPCRRYPATRHFYVTTLGMPVGKEGRHHCFLDTGGSMRLALVDATQLGPLTQPSGCGPFLNLSTDNLPALSRRLQMAAVRIEQETKDEFGQSVTIRDPEGNVIHIYQDGSF